MHTPKNFQTPANTPPNTPLQQLPNATIRPTTDAPNRNGSAQGGIPNMNGSALGGAPGLFHCWTQDDQTQNTTRTPLPPPGIPPRTPPLIPGIPVHNRRTHNGAQELLQKGHPKGATRHPKTLERTHRRTPTCHASIESHSNQPKKPPQNHVIFTQSCKTLIKKKYKILHNPANTPQLRGSTPLSHYEAPQPMHPCKNFSVRTCSIQYYKTKWWSTCWTCWALSQNIITKNNPMS